MFFPSFFILLMLDDCFKLNSLKFCMRFILYVMGGCFYCSSKETVLTSPPVYYYVSVLFMFEFCVFTFYFFFFCLTLLFLEGFNLIVVGHALISLLWLGLKKFPVINIQSFHFNKPKQESLCNM